MIIAVLPGVGSKTLQEQYENVIWITPTEQTREELIQTIRQEDKKEKIVFIPMQEELEDALVMQKIDFSLILVEVKNKPKDMDRKWLLMQWERLNRRIILQEQESLEEALKREGILLIPREKEKNG